MQPTQKSVPFAQKSISSPHFYRPLHQKLFCFFHLLVVYFCGPTPDQSSKKTTSGNRETPTKLVKACAKAAKAAPPMRACSLNSTDASPGQTLKVEKTLPTNFCRSQKKNNGN